MKTEGEEWQGIATFSFTGVQIPASSPGWMLGNALSGIINSVRIEFNPSMEIEYSLAYSCFEYCDSNYPCIGLQNSAQYGCKKCLWGYFLETISNYEIGECKACEDEGCYLCNSSGLSQCIKCDENDSKIYLQTLSVQEPGICVEQCSTGYYLDTSLSIPYCFPCTSSDCNVCTSEGENKCLICSSDFFHFSSSVDTEGTCISECNESGYLEYTDSDSNNHCIPCQDDNCAECNDIGECQCMKCSPSGSLTYKIADSIDQIGVCIESCPDDYQQTENDGYKYCTPKTGIEELAISDITVDGMISFAIAAIMMIAATIINGFTKGNIGAIWIMGGYMQLLTLFSIVQLPLIPKILIKYWNALAYISSLHIIPNFVQIFSGTSDPNNRPSYLIYNPSLSGMYFFANIGHDLTFTTFYILFYFLAVIISTVMRKGWIMEYRKRNEFNGLIRAITMMFFDYFLSSLVQIKFNFEIDFSENVTNSWNSLFALGFLLLCGGYIVFSCLFFYWHSGKLDTSYITSKFGSFYSEYKTTGLSKYSIFPFILRRLFSIGVLVLFPSHKYTSASLFMVITLCNLFWIGILRPFNLIYENILSIVNEVSLLAFHITFIIMMAKDMDEETVEDVGFRIYLIMQIIVFSNLAVVIIGMVIQILQWLKARKQNKLEKLNQMQIQKQFSARDQPLTLATQKKTTFTPVIDINSRDEESVDSEFPSHNVTLTKDFFKKENGSETPRTHPNSPTSYNYPNSPSPIMRFKQAMTQKHRNSVSSSHQQFSTSVRRFSVRMEKKPIQSFTNIHRNSIHVRTSQYFPSRSNTPVKFSQVVPQFTLSAHRVEREDTLEN